MVLLVFSLRNWFNEVKKIHSTNLILLFNNSTKEFGHILEFLLVFKNINFLLIKEKQ